MGNETPGARWAAYIRAALDERGWRPADLVRASGVKDNGRPIIDASRVSKWLDGQPPDYKLAVVAADAFGRNRSEVLAVAGYDAGVTGKISGEMPALEGRIRGVARDLGVPTAQLDEYVRVAVEDAAYLARRAARETAEDEARRILDTDTDKGTEKDTDVTPQTQKRRRRRAS